jgi:flagellar basal body-associated protein FliL
MLNMKKFLIVLCMIISIFSITANANASAQTPADPEAQLKSYTESIYQSLSGFSDADIEQYIAKGDEVTVTAVKSWSEIKDSLGDYVDMGEFTMEQSEDGIITKLVVDYSKNDMILTVTYDKNLQPTGIVAEQVGTSAASSKYPIGALIILAAVVIAIVFAYMKKNNATNSDDLKTDEPVANTPVVSRPVVATAVAGENLVNDFELVAVIAAAIAAATNSSTDDFVVRSIKRRTKIKR